MRRIQGIPGPLFGTRIIVTDDMRTQALVKTKEIVGKLDQLRKSLELPADQLPVVADAYGSVLMGLVDEAQQAEFDARTRELESQFSPPWGRYGGGHEHNFVGAGEYVPAGHMPGAEQARAHRTPMSIISRDRDGQPFKVKPGKPYEIITRPQTVAYRVEGIEIEGDASRWIVDDIRVGNRSQLPVRPSPNGMPGELFAKGALCSNIVLETCQTAMDIVFVVRYVGPERDGEEFKATAIGSQA